MAVRKIVAIRDRAVDAFGQPIFVVALGQGIRSFMDEMNNKESSLAAHPEDYDLYHIGEFDEDTGLLIACTPPKMIAVGKDMAKGPAELT